MAKILGRRRFRLVGTPGATIKSTVEYYVRWEGDKHLDSWEVHNSQPLLTVTSRVLIKSFIEDLKRTYSTYSAGDSKETFLNEEDAVKAKESRKSNFVSKLMSTTPFKDSPPSVKMKTSRKLLQSPIVNMKRMNSHPLKRKRGKGKKNLVLASMSDNTTDKAPVEGSLNAVNKALSTVAKSETSSVVSSSDEDVLYSLPEDAATGPKGEPLKKPSRKAPRKKLRLNIAHAELEASKASTPDTDPEISFKGSPNKRMLLKDSIRPKSQDAEAKSGESFIIITVKMFLVSRSFHQVCTDVSILNFSYYISLLSIDKYKVKA